MTSGKRMTFNNNQIFYQSFTKTQTVKRVLRSTIKCFMSKKRVNPTEALKWP